MTTNEILLLLVGIALACGVFALIVALMPRWQNSQGPTLRAMVESALQPLIGQAIMAAYRLSEQQVEHGYTRLKGANKKALADGAYHLLPERVGNFDIRFVKSLVPPERFRELVQDAFDQFDRFYLQHHDHFDEAFQQWAAVSKNATASPPLAKPYNEEKAAQS